MKVLCIDTPDHDFVKGGPPTPKIPIKENEVYTVISCLNFKGRLFYKLEETSILDSWDAELFIPLSDIDETELIEQRTQTIFINQ